MYNYYFHHMKLKSKFMFSHLLLALAPTLVFAVFAYNQLFNIITNNTLQSLQAISGQTATSIESSMSHLDSVITSIEEQEFFQSFLRNTNPSSTQTDAEFRIYLRSILFLLYEFIWMILITTLRGFILTVVFMLL